MDPTVTLSGMEVWTGLLSNPGLQVTRRGSPWGGDAPGRRQTSAGSARVNTPGTLTKDLIENTSRRRTRFLLKVSAASKFVIVKLQLTGSIFVTSSIECRNKLYFLRSIHCLLRSRQIDKTFFKLFLNLVS